MNILYLLNRYPKLSESFVINEIHELERRGHTIAVYSLREPEDNVHHDEVEEIDAPIGYLPDPSVGSALGTPGSWMTDHRILGRTLHPSSPVVHVGAMYVTGHLERFIRSLPFDIEHIHGHFLNWPKFAADYLAARYEVPWTTTVHAYGLFSDPKPRLNRRLLDRMDRVITISEYNRRYLQEEIGTVSPIDVVHMGINLEKFQPTSHVFENRILTVARFEEKKGITDGLAAIADLTNHYESIEYHLIGSGPREPHIRDMITDLGLEDVVSLLGHLSDDQLLRELDEASVFLLPCKVAKNGDRDGIPVAMMEAMAMKCVPISTRISGIPELITHGENGLLADPTNVASLTDQLYCLYDNEYAPNRCDIRRAVASAFSIDATVSTLEASFEKSKR